MGVRPAPKGTCRWCGLAILKTNGQPAPVTWHTACVAIYRIACFSGDQRRAVRDRDKGICAVCSIDCLRMMRRHSRNHHLYAKRPVWERYDRGQTLPNVARYHLAVERFDRHWWPKINRGLQNRQARSAAAGWLAHDRREGAWWQADHIRPLIESEGDISSYLLANLQTLCHLCHVA